MLHKTVKLSTALLIFSLLIIVTSAQLSSTIVIRSHGTIKWMSWLSVDGEYIVDEDGNRVQLRGAGCDYTGYNWYARLESYFQTLSSKGCNLVRLAINVPNHQLGGGSVYTPENMDKTLELCKQYGLYAIIDCHHYSEWPEWFDDLKQLWVDVAIRYKDEPQIAGYELMNEPYALGGSELRGYMQEITDAIRATGDNHIIIVPEFAKWTYEWVESEMDQYQDMRRFWGPGQILDSNTMVQVHHWPGGLARGVTDDMSKYYCAASEYVYFMLYLREQLQVPVWAGEFGSYNYTAPNNDLDHVINIMDMCDDYGIPWSVWMMEKNYPWDYLVPTPYASQYVSSDIPKPFDPKPFNMLDYTVDWNRREVGYNRWGSSFYELPGGASVTIQGPCQVRLVKWNNFYGYDVASEEIVDIPESETVTITRTWEEYTRIFAYSAP